MGKNNHDIMSEKRICYMTKKELCYQILSVFLSPHVTNYALIYTSDTNPWHSSEESTLLFVHVDPDQKWMRIESDFMPWRYKQHNMQRPVLRFHGHVCD